MITLAPRMKAPPPGAVRLARAVKAPGANLPAPGISAPRAPSVPAQGNPSPRGAATRFHPMHVLNNLATSSVLSGKQLNAAARALTTLETRPEVRGYTQIAQQLGQEKQLEDQGLMNLGQRTASNVGDVYQNIAASEAANLAHEQALGSMLNQQSSQIAQQGATDLTNMQRGQLGDLTSQLSMRGAPVGGGSAQQALVNAVAAQQATQNADSQASQQFAAQQAANYGVMGAGMAGAAQLQGGAAVGQIARDIAGRTAESDQKFNANIQTALEKVAEAKGSFGAKDAKNLLALRGGEQKFQLGQEAVNVNKGKLAATIAKNEASNKINQQKANAESKNAESSASKAATDEWKAHHPGASSTALADQRRKTVAYVKDIRSLIPSGVSTYGAPENQKQLNEFLNWVNEKTAAPPALVRHVVTNWYEKRQGREHQGHTHR